MIIESVEMENILSHRKTKIVLPRGVVAIIGPNGAGKTSIVDAITYALFSVHGRSARGIEKESLIRHGATYGRIVVEFTIKGRRYKLSRLFSKTDTRAELYALEGGQLKPIANSVKAVEAELRQLIGLEPRLAAELFFTRQGELESILLDKDTRIKLFDTLFGIKKIEKTHEELGKMIRELSSNAKNLEEVIKPLEKQVARLDSLKQELASTIARISEVENKLKQVEEKIKELERVEKDYQNLREQKARLESEKSLLTSTLRNLENEISDLNRKIVDTRRAIDEFKSILERVDSIDEALRIVRESLEVIDNLILIDRQIREKENRIKILDQQIKSIEESQKLAEEYLRLKERISQLEKNVKEYEIIQARIEEARRRINEIEQSIRVQYRDLRSLLSSSIDLSGVDTLDPGKILERIDYIYSELEKEIEKTRKKLEEVRGEENILEHSIRDAGDKLERLTVARGVCPLCGQPLSDEHRIELIKKISREKKEFEKKLEEKKSLSKRLEREISELEQKRRHVGHLRDMLREKVARIKQLHTGLEEIQGELTEFNKKQLELYPSYKEYTEIVDRLKELEQHYTRYTVLQEKIREKMENEKDLARLRALRSELYSNLTNLVKANYEDLLTIITVGELEKAKILLRGFEQKLVELSNKISLLSMLEDRLKDLGEKRESVDARLREIESSLRDIESRIKSLETSITMLNDYKSLYNKLREEYIALERDREHLSRQIEELKEMEKKLRKLEEKLDKINKAKNDLEKIRSILDPKKGLPKIIRQRARNLMEAYLRDILEKFNFGFTDIQLNDDYDVVIYVRGGQQTVSMLSGGERVALALAYRLALAKTAAKHVELLVMDEPTIHLDETRKRELVDIIRYGLEATELAQLVIITHDEEIEEAADCVIEVRKEGEESRILRSCEKPEVLGLLH